MKKTCPLSLISALSVWLIFSTVAASQAQPQRYRILVTNDDGVAAPGLAALAAELQKSNTVVVVAPSVDRSGASHAIGDLSREIQVTRHFKDGKLFGYGIDGTPAEAAVVGLVVFGKTNKFDLVVSGINPGGNVGSAAHISGTIAAAMQAVGQGVPAVAVSIDSTVRDFAFAARFAAQFVEQIKRRSLPRGVMLSINIPTVKEKLKGVVAARMGGFPVEDLESEKTKEIPPSAYYRIKAPSANRPADEGSDTQRYLEGFITITPLRFDWTDFPALESLKAWDLRLPGAAW